MLEAKRDASARSMGGHQANGVEFTVQDKPRGFFSFLTWPFYLAQAVAAEAVVGGMLRPVLADEENGDTAKARLTPTSNNDYETALREPGTAAGAEDVGSDTRAELKATEIDANSAPTGDEVGSPKEVEAVSSSGAGAGSNMRTGSAGANGSSGASSADGPGASSTHQGGGEANSVSEGPPGDALTFHPAINLHEAAEPVFESIAPVVAATTHATTDVVGLGFDAAEIIIEAIPGALSAPSSTVTNLFGVLESAPLVEGGASVTTAAQGFSSEFVGDALGPAESLLGMATTLVVGENEGLAKTTSSSATVLTDIISIADEIGGLPLENVGESLGSGGIIKFEETSSELSADDLFAEGRHTDYGLSLRTDAVTEPISEVVDRTIQSDEGQASSVGPNTDGGQDAGLFKPTKTPDPAEASLAGDVTSTFEDIGLRGSDSLL